MRRRGKTAKAGIFLIVFAFGLDVLVVFAGLQAVVFGAAVTPYSNAQLVVALGTAAALGGVGFLLYRIGTSPPPGGDE